MLPFLKTLEDWVKEAKDKSGFRLPDWPLAILGVVLLFIGFLFFPEGVTQALSLALFLAPLWLTVLTLSAAWFLWVILKRSEFIASQNYILLEIKPPRSVVKTPLAMEAVFAGLHLGPGESNWYKKYVKGGVRPYWSLEIASLEGQVHFFIWTRAGFRRLIEAQIYSQYPGAQVVEAPDYTKTITGAHGEWSVWGCDYIHTKKEDPYPIKTYVEYGLDKVADEPEQVDPLANLVEFMGSLGKGEYLWLQFIVRVSKWEKYAGKKDDKGKQWTWKSEAEKIVKEIRKATRDPFKDPVTGKESPGFPNPTKQQIETMAAIERNVSKHAFDVGARAIYLARPQNFNGITIAGLIGLFKQFSSEGWNGIKPTRWFVEFDDYPWEIGTERRKRRYQKEIVDAFRRRQFYYAPYPKEDYMIMSTEELATIFHIPSHAVETPSLPRIQSSTGEAPPNLPI